MLRAVPKGYVVLLQRDALDRSACASREGVCRVPVYEHDEARPAEEGAVGYCRAQGASPEYEQSAGPQPTEKDAQRQRADDEWVAGYAAEREGKVNVAYAQCPLAEDPAAQYRE